MVKRLKWRQWQAVHINTRLKKEKKGAEEEDIHGCSFMHIKGTLNLKKEDSLLQSLMTQFSLRQLNNVQGSLFCTSQFKSQEFYLSSRRTISCRIRETLDMYL